MKKTVAILAFAALLGAGATCCVDNRASISMQMLCYPNDTCEFSETCDVQLIGYPTIDVGSTGALVLFVQVANQVPNNEDTATGRVNSNDAHVDEIVAQFEGAVGGEMVIGANAYLPAGGTTVMDLPLLMPATVASGEAVARVRLRGYYDHGARFETGDFPITFFTCNGCLPLAACDPGVAACPQDGQAPLKCVQ
jgi:hypothetical protein